MTGFLLKNLAWLFWETFHSKKSFFLVQFVNCAKLLDCMLLDDNSPISSYLNLLLAKLL